MSIKKSLIFIILFVILKISSGKLLDVVCVVDVYIKLVYDTQYFGNDLGRDSYICGFESNYTVNSTDQINITITHLQNKSDENIEAVFFNYNFKHVPKEVYAKFPNLQYIKFGFSDFRSISSDWFINGTNLKGFLCVFLRMRTLKGKLFMNATKLQKLYLCENYMTNIEQDAFFGLNILDTLLLESNEIKDIGENLFENLKLLKILSLRTNELSHLKTNAFKGLSNLENLNLMFNKIKIIESLTFHHLINLNHINMEYNDMRSLSNDTFQNNLKLTHIIMGYNEISKMPRQIFSHLKNLNKINLQENVCISDHILNHNESIQFTEDMIQPCNCLEPISNNLEVLLNKFLKSLGIFSIVILFLAAFLFRKYDKSNVVNRNISVLI